MIQPTPQLLIQTFWQSFSHWAGKELRLKQQAFWTAASLSDIIRRWKKIGVPWSEFPHYVAIQLNDTHPALTVVELQRILIDEEDIPFDDAWQIVTKTISYTNHVRRLSPSDTCRRLLISLMHAC